MKKLILVLAVLVLVLTSCSKDDDGSKITLDENIVELYSNQEYNINATSDIPLAYESNNEYVAIIDNGKIIGKRIGEATIKVSNGKNTENINVTVKAKYNTYPDPFLGFGTPKNEIIAKFGTPKAESDNSIGYDNFSNKAPVIMFLFDKNNKLEATGVMVKTSYSSELGDFLAERYAFASYLPESYTIAMANGLDEKSITMGVGAKVYNLSYWLVTYFPFSFTKSIVQNNYSFDELIKKME